MATDDATRITAMNTWLTTLGTTTADTTPQAESLNDLKGYANDEKRRLAGGVNIAFDIGGSGFPQRRLDSTRTLI